MRGVIDCGAIFEPGDIRWWFATDWTVDGVGGADSHDELAGNRVGDIRSSAWDCKQRAVIFKNMELEVGLLLVKKNKTLLTHPDGTPTYYHNGGSLTSDHLTTQRVACYTSVSALYPFLCLYLQLGTPLDGSTRPCAAKHSVLLHAALEGYTVLLPGEKRWRRSGPRDAGQGGNVAHIDALVDRVEVEIFQV